MIKKLTVKLWISAIPILLICGVIAGILLSKYAPAALQALQGYTPELARTESMSNIYGISALGLFFVVMDVLIIFRQLTFSVGKRVRNYLAENPGVTQQQLDSDFSAAEQIGKNLWIGREWTFCYDMNNIPIENNKIALVYSETERVKKTVSYYLCLGLADGKVAKARVAENNLSHIKEIYARYPHILAGNNPEYIRMFKNDRNALLDIKYRNNVK